MSGRDQLRQQIAEAIWDSIDAQVRMGYVDREDGVIDIGMADSFSMLEVADAVIDAAGDYMAPPF